jgi:non-lysosomal glucosylceramidase
MTSTPENLGSNNVPGLPRLAEATFHGSFPLARIEFRDKELPVQVSLEALSSFQPVDADLSGLPCAVLSYQVRNPNRVGAEVVIAWCLENPIQYVHHSNDGDASEAVVSRADHRSNEPRKSAGIQGIFMTDPSLADDDPLKGSLVLAVLDEQNGGSSVRPYWPENDWRKVGIQRFWFDEFSKKGDLGQETEPHFPTGAVALRQRIPGGESRKYRFLLSWYFPNRTPKSCSRAAPKGEERALLGNYYCTRFSDAWAVAEYVQKNLAEIEEGTRAFVQTLQSSTLPAALIEAATANLPTLVSNTSFRMADGSFHSFEGSGDAQGWGFGTCSHVWNYEVATQFLLRWRNPCEPRRQLGTAPGVLRRGL